MTEFDRERLEDRQLQRGLLVKWGLAFAGLIFFVAAALWWSGSAVKYGASRVQGGGAPSYEVAGIVTDGVTHQPIPWASITTEITSGPQFFQTNADASGSFSLMTMAEPHKLIVKANGYREATVQVGRQWFSWLPTGAEKKNVELLPR
jgi:hypothetical protein